jgi:hypothetical protein
MISGWPWTGISKLGPGENPLDQRALRAGHRPMSVDFARSQILPSVQNRPFLTPAIGSPIETGSGTPVSFVRK